MAASPSPLPQFKADRKPRWKNFKSAKEIPQLPESQNDVDIYARWRYRDRAAGMPGLPDVPFLMAWNISKGDCYWSAISHLIYGDPHYWPIVKGQHYIWFSSVLADPSHRRHELYQQLNLDGQVAMVDSLEIPSHWASTSTMQVTADLYDIFLVMFIEIDNQPFIYTRGCSNAPHKFMQLVGEDHYEPIRPDVGCTSDYKFPVNDYDSSQTNVPIERSDFPGVLPEPLLPKPVLPQPTAELLGLVIGSKSSGSTAKKSSSKAKRLVSKAQTVRDYNKMTKLQMKAVLKTEYNYKGYSRLHGDAVRKTLARLDRQKAVVEAAAKKPAPVKATSKRAAVAKTVTKTATTKVVTVKTTGKKATAATATKSAAAKATGKKASAAKAAATARAVAKAITTMTTPIGAKGEARSGKRKIGKTASNTQSKKQKIT